MLLKRDDQQAVFSFKLRGAYNRMVQLDAVERTIHTMWSMAFGMTISRETWGLSSHHDPKVNKMTTVRRFAEVMQRAIPAWRPR